MRMLRLYVGILFVYFVHLSGPTSLPSQETDLEVAIKRSDDSALIDGLRRRRLFDLAELYCQQQLANSNIDPTSQSSLVVELIKTQTAKAVLALPSERKTAWNSINDTAVRFANANPKHPRKILVKVQLALSHITHGKLILQEIAAEMATGNATEEALAELRTAKSLLSSLQLDVDRAIPELRSRSVTAHDLSVEQLLTLKSNLNYQTAICNLNQSQLYAADDRLNRINALNNVKKSLAQVERSTSAGKPLWWTTKLGQMECFRLQGDTGAAKLIADSLPKKNVPTQLKAMVVEEKIRLAIVMGNETFSQQVIKEFDELVVTNAELDLAMIELAVALSARSPTDKQKKQWLAFASQSARAIELNHGGYWGRRADLVLIRAAGGSSTGGTSPTDPLVKTNEVPRAGMNSIANTELDQLVRLGEDAVRKNNLDDAIKAYDAAATKARALGDPDQALRLNMTVGQILEKQSQPGLAAERFIQAALKDTKANFASSSHLRGCWNLANTIKAKPENAKTFEKQLLRHLELWPGEPSADQARMYLASRYETTKRPNLALETYLQVRSGEQISNAINRAERIARRTLSQLRKAGKSTTSESKTLVDALQKKRNSLAADDPIGIRLELLSAELDLIYNGQSLNPNWDASLTAIENSTASNFANSARAIKAAIKSPTEPQLAKTLIEKIAGDFESLQLCERCFAAVELINGNNQSRQLRLQVIEELLNRSPSTSLLVRQSEVLGQLGRYSESLAVLRKLETQFPKNASIQIQLARALTQLSKGGDETEALNKWRRLQSKLKSQSPNWFEAKYNIAKLLAQSGKKAEAARLLMLLKEVGSGWDESKLKLEFESLLKSVQ